jgi:hypothetical protein
MHMMERKLKSLTRHGRYNRIKAGRVPDLSAENTVSPARSWTSINMGQGACQFKDGFLPAAECRPENLGWVLTGIVNSAYSQTCLTGSSRLRLDSKCNYRSLKPGPAAATRCRIIQRPSSVI